MREAGRGLVLLKNQNEGVFMLFFTANTSAAVLRGLATPDVALKLAEELSAGGSR